MAGNIVIGRNRLSGNLLQQDSSGQRSAGKPREPWPMLTITLR